jgi:cell wall-associated NlpC family hydrolase
VTPAAGLTRRRLLAGVAALAGCGRPTNARAQPKLPNPSTFQSGDLLWPKPPGVIIPYDASVSTVDEEDRWKAQRDAFVTAAAAPGADAAVKAAAAELARMSFLEFKVRYLGDTDPAAIVPQGAAVPIYLGHVAIVVIERDGSRSVVEAVMRGEASTPGTVRKIPYAKFVERRAEDDVWHGRFIGRSAAERAAVASVAEAQIGKAYDFFNFDLADASGFYCSKLVWFAAHRALKIALDDRSATFRFPWFSPKQCMRCSRYVCLLFSPSAVDGTSACP